MRAGPLNRLRIPAKLDQSGHLPSAVPNECSKQSACNICIERFYCPCLDSVVAGPISSRDVRERFPALGYEPVGSTPEEFGARFRQDLALYARVIREARIPLQD